MQIFYPPATNCSFPKCKRTQTRKQGWSGAVRVSVAPVGHMANPSALLSPRQKKLCRTWGKRVLNKLLLSLYVAEPELKCLVMLLVSYIIWKARSSRLKLTSEERAVPAQHAVDKSCTYWLLVSAWVCVHVCVYVCSCREVVRRMCDWLA